MLGIIVIGLIILFTKSLTEPERGLGIVINKPGPDIDNPIMIEEVIGIKSNSSKTMDDVGYYNRNSFTAANAKFGISYCRNADGNFLEDDKWPTITSKSHDVKPNSAIRDQITLTENGFPKDVYLCMIIVYNAEMVNDVTEINKNNLDKRGLDYPVYESKQIFFQIRN